ncbi:terpene synthase family protein [Streptomyces hiroshimensis]|uniref:Terpene synthase n=1 Tax=Streptomyces hiroshimensis TaxID=66424 RepID=A0ABQ2Y8U1_9ACTN|nr:hypothetical protein [Streptomyces hiroshimensis]GGX73873.1 hypothetical protein GCM10010324_18990 [Streptomyces hiroshimensis]
MTVTPRTDPLGHTVRVPELLVSLKAGLHPDHEAIRIASDTWTRQHLKLMGLEADWIDVFVSMRHEHWPCRVYPRGRTDRVRHAADLTVCVSVCDNLMTDMQRGLRPDRSAAMSAAVLRIVAGEAAPADDPQAVMTGRAWQALTAPMRPRQRARVCAGVRDYFAGEAMAAEIHRTGRRLTVEEYLPVRGYAIGARPFTAMIDHVLGLDLPDDLLDSPDMQQARELAVLHSALVNDLFSFGRECREGQWPFNALGILHFHQGLSLQEATDALCELIADHERRLHHLADAVKETPGRHPDLDAYLDGIGEFIAGNVPYHYFSPRYGGRGHVWDGHTTSGRATFLGDRLRIEP